LAGIRFCVHNCTRDDKADDRTVLLHSTCGSSLFGLYSFMCFTIWFIPFYIHCGLEKLVLCYVSSNSELHCCVGRVGVDEDREMQSFESLGIVIFYKVFCTVNG